MISGMNKVPMVMVRLNEDVIGTDTVWRAGEERPVDLYKAAGWLEGGVAEAVTSAPLCGSPSKRGEGRRLVTEAPERAVILPYVTPEGYPC